MFEDDYDQRSAAMNENYLAAFKALSPADREELARAGIDGPHIDLDLGSKWEKRANEDEREITVHEITLPEHREDEVDLLRELAPTLSAADAARILQFHARAVDDAVKRESGRLLLAIVSYLIQPNINHKLANWGLAFAAGLDCVLGISSQRAQATKMGESRQILNHYVTQWRIRLRYATFKWCRTDSARAAYAQRATEVHARNHSKCSLEAIAD